MKRIIYKIAYPFIRLYWRLCKPKTYGSRGIVLYGNNILLTKNIGVEHWSLPGGKIDVGETPEQCLTRELKEELDLSNINIEYKLGEYISDREGKKDTVYIFVVKLYSLDFMKQWELEDAKWFDISKLPENISPATSRRMKEFLSGKRDFTLNW